MCAGTTKETDHPARYQVVTRKPEESNPHPVGCPGFRDQVSTTGLSFHAPVRNCDSNRLYSRTGNAARKDVDLNHHPEG